MRSLLDLRYEWSNVVPPILAERPDISVPELARIVGVCGDEMDDFVYFLSELDEE